MGEVQDTGAHQGDRPVGGDIGKSDREGRDGRVDLEPDDDRRHPEDLERLGEWLGGVRRSRHLVRSQVAGQAVRGVARAPRQRAAGARRRAVAERVDPGGRSPGLRRSVSCRLELQPSGPEPPRPHRGRRVRVGGRRPPPTGQARREGFGWLELVLEPHDRRLVVPPVVHAVEVAIEEARDLVQLVEMGTGRCRVWPRMDPVPDQRVRWRRAAGLHPEYRIDVTVVPAADIEDRGLDRARSRVRVSPAASTARRSGAEARRTATAAWPRAGHATPPATDPPGTRHRAAWRSSPPG